MLQVSYNIIVLQQACCISCKTARHIIVPCWGSAHWCHPAKLSAILCAAQNSLVWYCRRQICGLLCHHPVCQPGGNRHWLHSHCWSQYGVSPLSLLFVYILRHIRSDTCFVVLVYIYMYMSNRQHFTDLHTPKKRHVSLPVCSALNVIVFGLAAIIIMGDSA